MFKKHKQQRSFTLIELLVVMVIIGILASLIVINVISNASKARDTRRRADLRTIADALDLYYQKYGTYLVSINPTVSPPTYCGYNGSGSGAFNCGSSCSSSYVCSVAQGLAATSILPSPPIDPSGSVTGTTTTSAYYAYQFNSGQYVCLYARLEGGPLGSEVQNKQILAGDSTKPCWAYPISNLNYNYVIRRTMTSLD